MVLFYQIFIFVLFCVVLTSRATFWWWSSKSKGLSMLQILGLFLDLIRGYLRFFNRHVFPLINPLEVCGPFLIFHIYGDIFFFLMRINENTLEWLKQWKWISLDPCSVGKIWFLVNFFYGKFFGKDFFFLKDFSFTQTQQTFIFSFSPIETQWRC